MWSYLVNEHLQTYLLKLHILHIYPGRLTWNIIMQVWKIIFLSKWVICRFDVNLPGCNNDLQSVQKKT